MRRSSCEGGVFLRFSVCRFGSDGKKLPVPLGWYLSQAAQKALDGQLTATRGEGSNADSLKSLREILAPREKSRSAEQDPG